MLNPVVEMVIEERKGDGLFPYTLVLEDGARHQDRVHDLDEVHAVLSDYQDHTGVVNNLPVRFMGLAQDQLFRRPGTKGS